jgi:DNA-binding response OmpR family regulator
VRARRASSLADEVALSAQKHRVLVVEDEHEAGSDLVRLLGECGCEASVVTNLRDARRQLAEALPCLILLDLQITSEPEALRTSEEHGRALLAEVSRANNAAGPAGHEVLVVVHSAYANDPEVAVELMYDGASYVLQKLASWRQKKDRLLRLLEKAGRTTHDRCPSGPSAAAASSAILSVPGERRGQRVRVALGAKDVWLPPGAMVVLLHLIRARLADELYRPARRGRTDISSRAHRAVSRLRELLAALETDAPAPLVETLHGDGYRLRQDVVVGAIDSEKLKAIGVATIRELADEIRRRIESLPNSDGG